MGVRHQIKLGFDHRQMRPVLGIGGGGSSLEYLYFSSAPDIAAGTALFYQIDSVDAAPPPTDLFQFFVFRRRRWRLNNRLSVTYGLRCRKSPFANRSRRSTASNSRRL